MDRRNLCREWRLAAHPCVRRLTDHARTHLFWEICAKSVQHFVFAKQHDAVVAFFGPRSLDLACQPLEVVQDVILAVARNRGLLLPHSSPEARWRFGTGSSISS